MSEPNRIFWTESNQTYSEPNPRIFLKTEAELKFKKSVLHIPIIYVTLYYTEDSCMLYCF